MHLSYNIGGSRVNFAKQKNIVLHDVELPSHMMSWRNRTPTLPGKNRILRRRIAATSRPIGVSSFVNAVATTIFLLMTMTSNSLIPSHHHVRMTDAMIIPTMPSVSASSTPLSSSSCFNGNNDGSNHNKVWASKVAHSFKTSDYKPSWFATNPHFQTIVSVLYRKETMYTPDFSFLRNLLPTKTAPPSATIGVQSEQSKRSTGCSRTKIVPLDEFQWDRRQRILTDDCDYYDIDWKYADTDQRRRGLLLLLDGDDLENEKVPVKTPPQQQSVEYENDRPVVIICHGLESCSDSPLAKDMAMSYNNINMDAICINFRGCSGECNLTPRAYHLGFTDDLFHLIRTIQGGQQKLQLPQRRIYLSGFSLGAGVVTKLLTELGDDASRYNICGAAVNAV
jgi:hypothetical protein